jgi:hypothetical protein
MVTLSQYHDALDDLVLIRFGCTLTALRLIEGAPGDQREARIKNTGANRRAVLDYLNRGTAERRAIVLRELGGV